MAPLLWMLVGLAFGAASPDALDSSLRTHGFAPSRFASDALRPADGARRAERSEPEDIRTRRWGGKGRLPLVIREEDSGTKKTPPKPAGGRKSFFDRVAAEQGGGVETMAELAQRLFSGVLQGQAGAHGSPVQVGARGFNRESLLPAQGGAGSVGLARGGPTELPKGASASGGRTGVVELPDGTLRLIKRPRGPAGVRETLWVREIVRRHGRRFLEAPKPVGYHRSGAETILVEEIPGRPHDFGTRSFSFEERANLFALAKLFGIEGLKEEHFLHVGGFVYLVDFERVGQDVGSSTLAAPSEWFPLDYLHEPSDYRRELESWSRKSREKAFRSGWKDTLAGLGFDPAERERLLKAVVANGERLPSLTGPGVEAAARAMLVQDAREGGTPESSMLKSRINRTPLERPDPTCGRVGSVARFVISSEAGLSYQTSFLSGSLSPLRVAEAKKLLEMRKGGLREPDFQALGGAFGESKARRCHLEAGRKLHELLKGSDPH